MDSALRSGSIENVVVHDVHVLYDVPGKFGGWPSIARTSEGELLVVFSGDRKFHVDPYGKTVLLRSRDNGQSWSGPQIINNSPLDDRDPGILICSDGSWLVSLFTSCLFADWPKASDYYGAEEVASWQPFIKDATAEVRQQYLGMFTLISRDQGKSWSKLRIAPVHGPHGPIISIDGELLYLGIDRNTPRHIACYSSDDLGESWQLRGLVAAAHALNDICLCEPHLLQLPDGRLIGQMRVNSADIEKRQLMQSVSEDGGRSWSPVLSTGIWGLPPHLLRHSSGIVLSSYGHRRNPFGQRVAMSLDNGTTWPLILSLATIDYKDKHDAEDVGEIYYQIPDLGYPATVELEDGSLYSVWYQSRAAGSGAIIKGCRWTLPIRG